MNIITEEQLELLCIDWFVELGYEYKDGHDIAPESNNSERDDHINFEIAPNGVKLDREEKSQFDALLEEISQDTFNKSKNREN